MKKVVRIFILLSVVAMSCVLICCSGGGSSSDGDVETEAPAVSTASTPTTTTPTIITTQTNWPARIMYTARRGEHINARGLADSEYDLYGNSGYAVPICGENMYVTPIDDLTTNPETARFWMNAEAGYYLDVYVHFYVALRLPYEIIDLEINPNTNCWIVSYYSN